MQPVSGFIMKNKSMVKSEKIVVYGALLGFSSRNRRKLQKKLLFTALCLGFPPETAVNCRKNCCLRRFAWIFPSEPP